MKLLPDLFARLFLVMLGLTVLVISLARASLEIQAQDINENNVWSRDMEFTINYGDGITETANYSFPEVGTLPTSPFYGFKQIRDSVWLFFSRGLDKPKLALLMADKKIEESRQLLAMNKNTEALAAGNEALDKLEYAETELSQIKGHDDQVKQLAKQVYLAGFAYAEVIEKGQNAFDMDNAEYLKLMQRNEEWNKNQKETRWKWDN